jgi:hypothetical protein
MCNNTGRITPTIVLGLEIPASEYDCLSPKDFVGRSQHIFIVNHNSRALVNWPGARGYCPEMLPGPRSLMCLQRRIPHVMPLSQSSEL